MLMHFWQVLWIKDRQFKERNKKWVHQAQIKGRVRAKDRVWVQGRVRMFERVWVKGRVMEEDRVLVKDRVLGHGRVLEKG